MHLTFYCFKSSLLPHTPLRQEFQIVACLGCKVRDVTESWAEQGGDVHVFPQYICSASLWPKTPVGCSYTTQQGEGDSWRWKREGNRKIEKKVGRGEKNQHRNGRDGKSRESTGIDGSFDACVCVCVCVSAQQSLTDVMLYFRWLSGFVSATFSLSSFYDKVRFSD